jgi:hypothetical protein
MVVAAQLIMNEVADLFLLLHCLPFWIFHSPVHWVHNFPLNIDLAVNGGVDLYS